MTAAAELPEGSVVIIDGHEFRRKADHLVWRWVSDTTDARYSDDGIDQALDQGAPLIRGRAASE